jgi:zinc ribbon protein
MALVECKECGAKISDNAATCPSCGDIIKEPKPRFSLLDAIHKISIPVVLSVAGTMITILTYFGQEEERKMEQTRKLLADAFEKDRSSSRRRRSVPPSESRLAEPTIAQRKVQPRRARP